MEKNDLIKRQEAIDAFMTSTSDGDKAEWCKWVLEQLPSAGPEVIKCKDCKNWQTDWTPIFSNFTPEDHFCSLVDSVTTDDFFCGYAERKENPKLKLASLYGKCVSDGE